MIGRRGFLSLFGVGLAAPAIVRASILMPVKPDIILPASSFVPSNSLLTVEMITRKSIQLFQNSAFMRSLPCDEEFGTYPKIGSVLRVRLPSDYTVLEGPALVSAPIPLPEISAPEAAVIGAAAALAKNPAMSRRFWAA